MKALLSSILLLFTTFAFGQRKNYMDDSIDVLVNQIAADNIFESYTVGYTGAISTQYQRFESLSAITPKERLLNLASHNENAVVRLYALMALKKKGVKIPETLIQKFTNDRTQVLFLSGCFGEFKSVNTIAGKPLARNNLIL